MHKTRKQSSSAHPLFFFMVQSADHISAATGLTPTVSISKDGAAFISPSGAITEIANGWYQVAGNTTDSGTLGELLLHATGTGADPSDTSYTILAADPFAAQWAANLTQVNAHAVSDTVSGYPDVNAKYYNAQATQTDANNLPKVDVEDLKGTASAGAAGSVGVDWGQVINKTTTNALTNTTISTTQTITSVSGSVGSVTGAVGSITGVTFPTNFGSLVIDADGRASAAVDVRKNKATSNMLFLMTDTSGNPVGGKVDADFSIKQVIVDSAAAATIAGTITAATGATGWYKVNLAAGETNGEWLGFQFQCTGSALRAFTVRTSA